MLNMMLNPILMQILGNMQSLQNLLLMQKMQNMQHLQIMQHMQKKGTMIAEYQDRLQKDVAFYYLLK